MKPLARFGLSVLATAAIVHAYRMVVEFRIMKRAHPFEADLFPARLQLFLLVAFLLIAGGLLIGTRVGLVCSLMCLFASHLAWLYYSHDMLYVVNQNGLYERHPELIPPNLWGFVGARWWDPCVANIVHHPPRLGNQNAGKNGIETEIARRRDEMHPVVA